MFFNKIKTHNARPSRVGLALRSETNLPVSIPLSPKCKSQTVNFHYVKENSLTWTEMLNHITQINPIWTKLTFCLFLRYRVLTFLMLLLCRETIVEIYRHSKTCSWEPKPNYHEQIGCHLSINITVFFSIENLLRQRHISCLAVVITLEVLPLFRGKISRSWRMMTSINGPIQTLRWRELSKLKAEQILNWRFDVIN